MAQTAPLAPLLSPPCLDDAFVEGLRRVVGLDVTFYAAERAVATTLPSAEERGRRTEAAPLWLWNQVAQSGEPVQQEGRDRRGPFIARYSPLRDPAGDVIGMVGVRASPAALSAGRREVMSVFAGVVGVVVVLALLVGAYAAWALGRPLAALVGAVERIGNGELARPIPPEARARRDEVGALAEAVEQMRVRLQQYAADQEALARLKDQYLSSVAHELRSPLASLGASVELLAGEPEHEEVSPAERRHLTGIVQRKMAGLQSLVDNLLDQGSLRAGRFRVDPRPAALEPIVTDAVASIQPFLDGLSQDVQCDLDATLPLVLVDPRRLQQVLVNLLSNSSKYGREGDTLVIRAVRHNHEHEVQIEVIDHGAGIPLEDQPRLFDPFFRASATRSAATGAGLGLAIVRAIIEAHGGRVGVQSDPGHGTCVWLRVPVAQTPAAISQPVVSSTGGP